MPLHDFCITEAHLTVRPLEKADGPHLFRWLNDPDVLQYYEGRDKPQSWEAIQSRFLSKTGNPVRGCLIVFDDRPTGYLQVYPLTPAQQREYGLPLGESIFSLDLFIGEVTRWNQGLGTQVVRLVSHALTSDYDAQET